MSNSLILTPLDNTTNGLPAQGSYTGSYDVSALTVNDWYRAEVYMDFAPGNESTREWYLMYLKEDITS